jgi:membrane protease YdiL (CAAX protease family)
MLSSYASEKLLLTLWIGGLWAIGYLAVPMAFASLGDVSLAGEYAGKLFFAINLLGLGCGSVLIIGKLIQYKKNVKQLWRFWILVLMVIMTLIFSFYLQPQMAELKQLDWQENQQLIDQFSLLHTISENLFLILSLLGLTLVLSTDKQISFDKAA